MIAEYWALSLTSAHSRASRNDRLASTNTQSASARLAATAVSRTRPSRQQAPATTASSKAIVRCEAAAPPRSGDSIQARKADAAISSAPMVPTMRGTGPRPGSAARASGSAAIPVAVQDLKLRPCIAALPRVLVLRQLQFEQRDLGAIDDVD